MWRSTGTAPDALAAPHFVSETAGIDHRYDGDFQYFVGGGVAAFDCDDDGRPEVPGRRVEPAALYRNESPVGGALHFTRVRTPATDVDAVIGAYPLDVDGDRRTDLVVLRVGESLLLRGLGRLPVRARERGVRVRRRRTAMPTAFSATWESRRTAHVAIGATSRSSEGRPTDVRGQPCWCDRRRAAVCPGDRPATGYCALSMLFSDWDRSGRRDLRISNDRALLRYVDGEEQLWRWSRVSRRARTRRTRMGPGPVWGMASAARTSPETATRGVPDEPGSNRLQTLAAGAEQPTYGTSAWLGVAAPQPFTGGDTRRPPPGTEFEDVNRDGFVDLFISKGNVGEADFATQDPEQPVARPARRHVRRGRRPAGVLSCTAARGAALADLNLDGLLDLVSSTAANRWRCGATSAAGDAGTGPMGGGSSPSGCVNRLPTSTPSVPGSRRASAIEQRAGRSRWAVAMPVVSSGGSTSASATSTSWGGAGAVAGRGAGTVDDTAGGSVRDHRAGGGRGDAVAAGGGGAMTGDREPGPDAGDGAIDGGGRSWLTPGLQPASDSIAVR